MTCADDDTTRFAPAVDSYELPRGDTLVLEWDFEELVDPDADPDDPATEWQAMDLTGSTWRLQLRVGHPDGTLLREPVVDDSQAGSGVITVDVGDTSVMVPGVEYHYDLERTDPDGFVSTLVVGVIEVDADTTKTEPQ